MTKVDSGAVDGLTRSMVPTRVARRSGGPPGGYVPAIGCGRWVPTAAGPMRIDTLAADLPKGV